MTLAHDKNGLIGPEIKPWHIRATYHSYDKKGRPEYEGTYEEWWASPTIYKLSFTSPKSTRTDYANGTTLFRDGSPEWQSGPELSLRASLVDPLLDASMLGQFKLESRNVDVGKVRLPCVALTYPLRSNIQVPGDFYPAACFEATMPVLRLYSDGPFRTLYDRDVLFQGHYVPRQIQVFMSGRLVADMNVDLIETLKDSPDSITAAPSSALPVDLTKITFKEGMGSRWPILFKKAFPVYPDDAKSRRIQGSVNLRATIGPDGSVQDLQTIDGPGMLRQAAIDAVRQWLYKPFDVMGEPRPVQIEVHVIFQLG